MKPTTEAFITGLGKLLAPPAYRRASDNLVEGAIRADLGDLVSSESFYWSLTGDEIFVATSDQDESGNYWGFYEKIENCPNLDSIETALHNGERTSWAVALGPPTAGLASTWLTGDPQHVGFSIYGSMALLVIGNGFSFLYETGRDIVLYANKIHNTW